MIELINFADFSIEEVVLIARLCAKVRSDIRKKDVTLRWLRSIEKTFGAFNPYYNSRMRITPAIWGAVAPCISLRVERTCSDLITLENHAERLLNPFGYGDRVEYKDNIHTITHTHPFGECTLDHHIRVKAADLKPAPLPSPAMDVSGLAFDFITAKMAKEMASNEGAHLRVYTRGFLVKSINDTISGMDRVDQSLDVSEIITHLENCRVYGILADSDYFKALPIVQMSYPNRYRLILVSLRDALQTGKSIIAALRQATIITEFK